MTIKREDLIPKDLDTVEESGARRTPQNVDQRIWEELDP